MQPQFWKDRWQANQIGFHQPSIPDYLPDLWSVFNQQGIQTHVFVPLCGKSQDMIWLSQQGCQVTGVEISELAVQQFFTENKLPYQHIQGESLSHYQHEQIEIYCGDFFEFGRQQMPSASLVYDRAALIALPETMRAEYARHLNAHVAPQGQIFLVTLSYPQTQMTGPPFSVDETEVQALFSAHYDIQCLQRTDILAEEPRFKARGLTELHENVYRLQKKVIT